MHTVRYISAAAIVNLCCILGLVISSTGNSNAEPACTGVSISTDYCRKELESIIIYNISERLKSELEKMDESVRENIPYEIQNGTSDLESLISDLMKQINNTHQKLIKKMEDKTESQPEQTTDSVQEHITTDFVKSPTIANKDPADNLFHHLITGTTVGCLVIIILILMAGAGLYTHFKKRMKMRRTGSNNQKLNADSQQDLPDSDNPEPQHLLN